MAFLRRQITQPGSPIEYDAESAALDARRIASNYTLNMRPLDVEALAWSLGLKVEKRALDSGVSGYLHFKDGVWILGVNSLHHPNRQRFTMAHEIGHYFLHRHLGEFNDNLFFRAKPSIDPIENQANQFAALLLMPANEFTILANDNSIEFAAKEFGVSVQAANYRLKNVSNSYGQR